MPCGAICAIDAYQCFVYIAYKKTVSQIGENLNCPHPVLLFPFQCDNVPEECFQFRQVVSMTKSSYRKAYIPHTEIKPRTNLQYYYS